VHLRLVLIRFSLISGAQTAVASLAINYMTENGVPISASLASNLFSAQQATFTFARFVSVGILHYIDLALLLSFYALMCVIFSLAASQASGWAGVGCLFVVFYFESICYCVRSSPHILPRALILSSLIGYLYPRH
jgi:FHS family L-fucose permease-like MFS transporter